MGDFSCWDKGTPKYLKIIHGPYISFTVKENFIGLVVGEIFTIHTHKDILLLIFKEINIIPIILGSSIPVIATGANAIPLGGGATAEDQEDEGKSEQGTR